MKKETIALIREIKDISDDLDLEMEFVLEAYRLAIQEKRMKEDLNLKKALKETIDTLKENAAEHLKQMNVTVHPQNSSNFQA